MTEAPEKQNIHQAMHAVRSAMSLHGIAKDNSNKEQGYKFRGIDDIFNALSEQFVEHRINVVPRYRHVETIARQTGSGKPMPASFVQAEIDLYSVDDGSMVTLQMPGEGADMADKGTNKSISAATKYAMLIAFTIPTKGIMEEGDATTPGQERDEQRQQDRGSDRQQGNGQRSNGGGNAGRQADRTPEQDAERYCTNFITWVQKCEDIKLLDARIAQEQIGINRLKDDYPRLFAQFDHAKGLAYARLDDVPF